MHTYIKYVNITCASTSKTKLKILLGKQNQAAARIIFNQDRFIHAHLLLKL